jgi:hypothetical protein
MVRNQFTVFVVERRKSDKMENYFLGGTSLSRNTNLVLGYYQPSQAIMAFWSNDTLAPVPGYRGSTEPTRIFCFRKPTGPREIYINGGPRNAGNSNTETLQSWNGAALGRYFDRFYQGVVYEVLIYNQALSDEVRQKVEGYLAHKWAVTQELPANHPFKTSTP